METWTCTVASMEGLFKSLCAIWCVFWTLYSRNLWRRCSKGILGLTQAEKDHIQGYGFDVEAYFHSIGGDNRQDLDAVQVMEARWCLPSISVSSITTSNKSHGFRKMPRKCTAKVSVHFVPNQKCTVIEQALVERIQGSFNSIGSHNTLDVEVTQVSKYWLGNFEEAVFNKCALAIQQVWGIKPRLVREGGSYGGITSALEEKFGAPALHLPLGGYTDDAHLPNERIKVENLLKGKEVFKLFLEGL